MFQLKFLTDSHCEASVDVSTVSTEHFAFPGRSWKRKDDKSVTVEMDCGGFRPLRLYH